MSNLNFRPRAVSDFLASDETDRYIFDIPSFQRGYRWTSKQVLDLLKDLSDFAKDTSDSSTIYYLQPLVVRGKGFRWEVLDGQQRLTTLKLILDALRDFGRRSVEKLIDYDINYLIRPNFDFFKAKPTDNLDSYYVANARKTISTWIDAQEQDDLSELADVMFGQNKSKKVKFIWYEAEGEDSTDSGAIAIFNRLNRGKIKLTPSELIKALLIISAQRAGRNSDYLTVLSMEWNEIERQFMRDDFFAFINTGNKAYDTRTDLLFNHIVLSKGVNDRDDDFAYRWFQNKYDNGESITDIWDRDVKSVFDMLMQWYADPEMYNYIGFLSQYGVRIGDIRDRLAHTRQEFKAAGRQWLKTDNMDVLGSLIREQFKPLQINGTELDYPKAIDELDYNVNQNDIRRVLLLFNVVTYSAQRLRFPFDRYVSEKWDIEHVDSQTENPLVKNEDQKNWLTYTGEIIGEISSDKGIVAEIKADIENCLAEDIKSPQWIGLYKSVYKKVMSAVRPDRPVADKDSLGNLTLLDAATNRGYGNALFPYKRKCVVKREQDGKFVPACTRNLFLKYYTSGDGDTAGISRMKWSEDDAQAHLSAIHNALDSFFK